ncbi:MAG: preprotein translocase subunit SecA [Candidatus Pacebacteria bacterium]|nr:preprotein translocase subunit SecA [Candidatus Paceibacterota bacterium]
MSFLTKIIGDSNKRFLKKLEPVVAKINELEKDFEKLSAEELKAKTTEFKKRLDEGQTLDDILPEAFAAVREAAKRTLKQRHYDVQLLGGIVLHQGKIAEMKTGEGKTLVATLPAYLNALTGKGVHVVTVNDYLSRRDAVWMGQIYNALGLSVGCINHEASYLYDAEHTQAQSSKLKAQNDNAKLKTENTEDGLDQERDTTGAFHVVHEYLRPCSRREAYLADITYGTNNEFGFDYLRDNISYDVNHLSQREHNFAIVDEIDSILIDEARTPLIISAPSADSDEFYIMFAKIAQKMDNEADFKVDEKHRAITLTEQGIEKAEKLLGVSNIYTEKGIKHVHHLETAIRAKALFHKDKEYVVKNGEVIIVDEFTGRMMPGRRWSEGLHQAVEAKEGVSVQKESRTLASITFQNYFRLFKKLAGMTGTALTSAEEFHKVYNLETVNMPTNKPLARMDKADLVFQTEKGKFSAIVEKVKELHGKGQPVLVGTVSIDKNEYLSSLLKIEGVPHKVLNAKHHEEEGEIIAQSGHKGGVTIATNMAGRGVDIVLGGNPPKKEEAEEVRKLGGLFVLGTERHEARRIDNQLRGRSGRQGDPGETQFFISLEDDVMRIFGSDRLKNFMGRMGIPENEPIENRMLSRAIESAQSKIEGFNFDTRKHLLEYDDVLNHQRKIIYEKRKKILHGDKDFIIEELRTIISEQEALEKRKEELGEEKFFGVQRALMLQAIDMHWVEHLEAMDYLRSSVRLRAYGQRDPLVEYKNEGLRMFRDMEGGIGAAIAEMALKVGEDMRQPREQQVIEAHPSGVVIGDKPSQTSSAQNTSTASKEVGRNDPCPCGSGKKYKKCHGA